MTMKKPVGLILGIIAIGSLALTGVSDRKPAAQAGVERNFEIVAVEIQKTKFWLPSTLIAKKGDKIKIHAISKIPGANNIHGWAIDDYKIQELIDGKGKDFEFVADKAGVFNIRCHLHPTHIGGQLLVTE